MNELFSRVYHPNFGWYVVKAENRGLQKIIVILMRDRKSVGNHRKRAIVDKTHNAIWIHFFLKLNCHVTDLSKTVDTPGDSIDR